jgi:hypothetical protein
MESRLGSTEAAAPKAIEDQKGYSLSVNFLGDNNSGFQLGQNTGIISGFTFGKSN